MSRADGKVFELLTDDVSRELLRLLLRSDEPLDQRALIAGAGVTSSTVSRRMGALEDAGLVERRSVRSPYELTFPSKTRELLLAASDLAHLALDRLAAQAAAEARGLRKEGMAGGLLNDLAKEQQ